ncbi:MAG: potassium channel family protein [Chloroflexota bacterium]
MRVVILGCGRVGAHLANQLDAEGHDVTIIDRNSDQFRRLSAEFGGQAVVGTGIDQDILRRAGIESADVYVTVTNGDNTNVMSAQIAKHIFHVPRVITRIYDPVREETYRILGLETFSPTVLGAEKVRELMQLPVSTPSGQTSR